MIEVKNLTKNYGDRRAVYRLNFKIEKGDVVGLLGPNGAGKSTTMKMLTGFMSPTSGEAIICGYNIFSNPIEVKKRIGYLPETPPLYMDMRVQDYLAYVAELKLVPKGQIHQFVDEALEKTQLCEVKSRIIQNLSKGFKQRVGLAQALVSNPEILILDEPTVGLDPKQVAEIRDLIRQLKGSHTIILSTHILSEVQATCNKVIIINKGEIVAQDSIEKIESLGGKNNLLTLHLKIRKEQDIKNILLKIDGVQSVVMNDLRNYDIVITTKEDAIDSLAMQVIQSGAGLVQIAPIQSQLEDVFLKLTYGQQSLPEAL